MKYFLIAGEASGDLHASHLISALKERDSEAEFRFYGGDLMAAAAGTSGELLRHYNTLAYMGFIQVALHARTILKGLKDCKQAIQDWTPDCIILIDYPGFNLKIAKYVHEAGICPVYYYISPKIWAWKEYRIKDIRANVDRLFSILPFEVEFFEQKHNYPISYVGNPTYDEIAQHLEHKNLDISNISSYGQASDLRKNCMALLPGSRKQEISSNLPVMLKALQIPLGIEEKPEVQICLAPNIERSFYDEILKNVGNIPYELKFWEGSAFDLLLRARVAFVTSGTATLETAILDVPQVVCYHMVGGRLVNFARPYFLSCPFISLVNLIVGREIVPELIAAEMQPKVLHQHLQELWQGPAREKQLSGYIEMRNRLQSTGAPVKAATEIVDLLKKA